VGCERLAALAALALAGCFALPPSRTELATVAHGSGTGYRFATGGHSASAPKQIDVPFDLGAGYIYEQVGDGDGQHGNYIELSRQVWHQGSTRAFVGGRVEVFWNDVGELGTTRAASARIAIEKVAAHVAGAGGQSGSGAAVYGLFAPGVYLEAGVRELERGDTTGTVTAGLYVRLPFLFAASKPTIY